MSNSEKSVFLNEQIRCSYALTYLPCLKCPNHTWQICLLVERVAYQNGFIVTYQETQHCFCWIMEVSFSPCSEDL